MIIYSHTLSPRLLYVAQFIGKELLGESIPVTTDDKVFGDAKGPRICYANTSSNAEDFLIQPHTLLFENNIHEQQANCFVQHGYKAFFATGGDFSFDIFSAVFYLLSRYEEYLPHQKDMYGRYAHENSIAFKEGFLHLPLINIWLKEFESAIRIKFPDFQTRQPQFRFLPTYDIDEAWAYKNKGFIRSAGGATKALIKGQGPRIKERSQVLKGKLKDPYDSYDWLDQLHRECKLEPRYFFLLAKKNKKFDRNILPEQRNLQELIQRHAAKYPLGIHPSWQSGDSPSLIEEEIHTLEKISGQKVTASRQHYIRFSLPSTFRYLINAGIRDDYSMGYGSINGFRASVASPFYWYDLEKDQASQLLLYPFCFMEANSFFEQKVSSESASREMYDYYKVVKAVGGTYSSIWHNSFLGTERIFAGWREIYSNFVKEIADQTPSASG